MNPGVRSQKSESGNLFAVVRAGEYVTISGRYPRVLTRDEALNLAAWLSVLADPEGAEFNRLVEAIKRT